MFLIEKENENGQHASAKTGYNAIWLGNEVGEIMLVINFRKRNNIYLEYVSKFDHTELHII